MKRSIFSKSLALILCLLLAFGTFSLNVFAINEDADLDMGDDVIIATNPKEVYVSASGNDSYDGSESAPFATLAKATSKVASNGTIHVVGTVSVPAGTTWAERNLESVTVIGGTLNLGGDLAIGFSTIFKDITISGSKSLYANGKDVVFDNVNASAIKIYGGSNSKTMLDSANITINSGTFDTVYGGGSIAGTIKEVNLTINGGTISNVFGGNSAGNLTGDITIDIKGGTINSSIFGGCYNDFSAGSWITSAKWSSNYYVTGTINLILRKGVTLNVNSGDRSIFAHTRGAVQTAEITNVIFLDESFYESTKGKLAAHSTASASWGGKIINDMMGKEVANSADYVHLHSINADDDADTLTEGCTLKAPEGSTSPCTASTATLKFDKSVSLIYTGSAIEPAIAQVNGALLFGEPTITYANNSAPGTATATMTLAGVSVNKEFVISKQNQIAPANLTVSNETISGKADGKINNLTTAMEISTDDATYSKITNVNADFAAGTYYVRYAETDYRNASPSIKVVIEAGKKLVVKFIADGNEVNAIEVDYGATLTDIPTVPSKVGYDKVAPTWDVTDFTNITSDINVNAVYTINTYTVKYVADGNVVSEQTVNYGANAVAPEIPSKEGYTETAPYWDAEATNVTTDLTINAVYTKDLPKITPADTNNDGKVNLKDLIALAQYVADWDNSGAYVPALDIDGDNNVDLDDVNTLARYLAGWSVEISKNPYLG